MKKFSILILAILMCLPAFSRKLTINLADYGVVPGASQLSSKLDAALTKIQQQVAPTDKVVLRLEKGEYHFHSEDASVVRCYISNHDQEDSKRVAIRFVGWNNLTLDGKGAELVFHGRLVPVMISECANTTLRNFSVDFANPQIAQVEIVENLGDGGMKFRVAPWVNYRIGQNGRFETFGEGWTAQQSAGIAFENDTRHIVYQTSDIGINTQGVQHIESDDRLMLAPHWKDGRLIPGTVVAMRTWFRPTPGIFMNESKNTTLRNVRVHYAEGMGLLAQRCTDVTLDKFGVCLKGDSDPRYFTTQADATHFSQCRGLIKSCGGLYEGMMDDAINIHGVYLRVRERIDDHTLRLRYEHGQAWGFGWGDVGDTVTFVRSAEMEDLGFRTTIKAISPDNPLGTKEFVVTFRDALPKEITADKGYGVENLTWTPEVIFNNNIVRNNRARGSLFSSPRRTVCEGNLFDHTSGTAILLCGDCNGWYESGACRDLVIRKNRFVNALTNYFQFTNAVISIYPEIPTLDKQQSYFHGGKKGAIVIEDNLFETFDAPILYAKSVDGLVFRGNKVVRNNDYKPFHWNKKAILLERVINAEISDNEAME
ncbi:MAG: alpha-1,3-galactosidase B [Bacteroidaceae bacterium]|nr:alpha-1,3-galactosidase B [Bacteroidaceae bacterium]